MSVSRSTLPRVAAVVACSLASLLVRPAPAAAQLIAGQAIEEATRAPLVGLPIRLLRHPVGGGAPAVVDSGRTFDRGLFQIQAPGPGVYQLEFGVARAAVSTGPVDTLAADAFVQRQYDIPLLRRPDGRAFFEFQVQQPVRQRAGMNAPVYPEDLKQMGVEGTVLSQFVVDANGDVVPGSFKVLRATDQAFTDAVARAVRTMRFHPARIGGVAVHQLVQQPFEFRLTR